MTLPGLLGVHLHDAQEVSNGRIKMAVLFVGQAGEVGNRPRGCGRIVVGRATQSGDGVVESALLEIDPRDVQRTVRPAEPLDLGERRFGLAEFALVRARPTLAQQPDPVVVPALPGRDRRVGRRHRHADARNRERHRILGEGKDRQVVRRERAALEVLHVQRIELAVAKLDIHRDRSGQIVGHAKRAVNDIARPRRNLVIVQRDEDVLGVASIDPVSLAIDYVGVDEMRPGVDPAIVGLHASTAPDDSISASYRDVEPHLIGIGRPLGEQVAHLDRANHRLE